MAIDIQYHKSAIGELIIGSHEDELCLLDFRYRKMRQAVDKRLKEGLDCEFAEQENPVNQLAITQLEEYLAGTRKEFDLPIKLVGSEFQQTVWHELMKIPYGQTVSYGELAENLGDPKSVRAVASANGANAIAVIIPCHRLIRADGSLTGYGGGLSVKQKLLNLESPDLFSDISMPSHAPGFEPGC